MKKPLQKPFVSVSDLLLTLLVLLLAMAGGSKGEGQSDSYNVELWCVAKNNAPDSVLQAALDWACGHGGTDCSPIQAGGPCYDPTDVQSLASFAFNDYFLKNGLSQQSCDFSGAAALTSLNPSHGNCLFPSSFSVSNGTSVPGSIAGVVVPPPGIYTSGFEGGIERGRAYAYAAAAEIMAVFLLTLYPS